MDATQALCEALEQKKELFLAYEQTTASLMQCAAEDIEHYITNRTELAIEIDKLNEKIEEICCKHPQGTLLHDAVCNRCDCGELPPGFIAVFEMGQEVLGVMNRVAVQEPAIMGRMQGLLSEYRAGIASTQNAPKIARYLDGMKGNEDLTLLGRHGTV